MSSSITMSTTKHELWAIHNALWRVIHDLQDGRDAAAEETKCIPPGYYTFPSLIDRLEKTADRLLSVVGDVIDDELYGDDGWNPQTTDITQVGGGGITVDAYDGCVKILVDTTNYLSNLPSTPGMTYTTIVSLDPIRRMCWRIN